MNDSSNSSSGGNANSPLKGTLEKKKQGSPAVRWCLRLANYPEDWVSSIVPKLEQGGCRGWIIGEEICPSTGTPHLQGYAEWPTGEKIRPYPGLGLPKETHWIAAKGSKESNMVYCSKEGKYQSWGTCKKKPKYTIDIELYEWEKRIVEILDSPPDDRKIYWIWEQQGCRGKTTFQKWIFLNYKRIAVLSGKASDMKNGIVQFEEKNGELPEIVLVNIPRCQDTDHVSWQGLEEIKDMFFYSGKYEGGMVCGPNPHMFIFSNERPPLWKLSEDRWVVWDIS